MAVTFLYIFDTYYVVGMPIWSPDSRILQAAFLIWCILRPVCALFVLILSDDCLFSFLSMTGVSLIWMMYIFCVEICLLP